MLTDDEVKQILNTLKQREGLTEEDVKSIAQTGETRVRSGYPFTPQYPEVHYSLGDHVKVKSSRKRNDLIKSGEWREVMLLKDGWYILEKIR